jgi:hypothetical protein
MSYNRFPKSEYYVYFARAGGLMKIGCSRRPVDRLVQIAEWIPFQIELAAVCPGAFDFEAALHAHFAESWSHLEWFHATPEMEAMVADINAGKPIDLAPQRKDHAKELAKTLKKRASRRVTMAEKRSGIGGRYDNRERPPYLLEAMASYDGPHSPPPSPLALAAIARYEAELAAPLAQAA